MEITKSKLFQGVKGKKCITEIMLTVLKSNVWIHNM